MKTFQSFDDLIAAYFVPNQFGFDNWTVIKMTYLKEESASVVTLANPLVNEFLKVAVRCDSVADFESFRKDYRLHYHSQFDHRFGFFLPEARTGDVEYESFELFSKYWIESEGRTVLPYNIPLLVDFPSNLEYAEAKEDGTMAVNYQRLLMVVAQPRKRAIKRLFIRGVDETNLPEVQQFIKAKVQQNLESIF